MNELDDCQCGENRVKFQSPNFKIGFRPRPKRKPAQIDHWSASPYLLPCCQTQPTHSKQGIQMGETETVIFITTDKNGERIDYRIQVLFKQ